VHVVMATPNDCAPPSGKQCVGGRQVCFAYTPI
jgi:hypothetical protein